MKKLARREKWMDFGIGLTLGLLATFWIVQDALTDLKTANANEKKVSEKLRLTKKLLAKGPDVAAQLEVLQKRLPKYGPDRDVTAEQMRTFDRIASEQSFELGQREPQAEGTNSTVREIVIRTAWDSNLDALTHFLFALQTQDVIFDVRRLTIIPVQGQTDRLKGQLVINSAYAVSDEPTGTNTVAVAGTNAPAAMDTNAPASVVTNPAVEAVATNLPAAITNPAAANPAPAAPEAIAPAPVPVTITVSTNPPAPAAVNATTNQPGNP